MACQLLAGLTSAGRAFYGTFQCRPASLKTCKMNESVIWSAGCRGQPPPRLARGIATPPLPVAHAARRKPRTWPTTKTGLWICNALS